VVESSLGSVAQRAIVGSRLRASRDALMQAVFFSAIVAWAMLVGKDVGWDVVNHQLYLPFSWVSGRFRTDLFAAGPQSYQNPLGYFPLYVLVSAGLPAWVIGVLFATLHALVVWPLARIARLFWPRDTSDDFWMRFLAMGLGCVTPVFLIHAGTPSIDPITSLFVIWALALSLELGQGRPREWRAAAAAGALLGLSSALKLSNAVFAVAFCGLWALKWTAGQADRRRLVAFGAGLGAAFMAAAGPWMLWLWQDFGNPIYPLYNELFHSPLAPQQPVAAIRFLPTTLADVAYRLWDLTTLRSYVSLESSIPDVRPFAAAVAGVAALVALGVRGGWRRLVTSAPWRSPGVQLGLAMVVMYVLWMRTSGNARYGLPLFMLAGIALVRATQCALPLKAAKVLLLAALLVQGAYYYEAGDHRATAARWDAGPYVEFQVPQRLREKPFLHLVIGAQTMSAAALFLDPRGAMANPIGQFALPTDGPLGARLQSLMDRWHGRTRLLMSDRHPTTPADVKHTREALHALLYRLGLDVDWSDCESIAVVLDRSDLHEAPGAGGKMTTDRRLLSCAVLYRPERDPEIERTRIEADRVFAILEAACPKVFTPTPLTSEHGVGVWQRHYMNTEAQLSVSPEDGIYFSHYRSLRGAHFGSIDDVLHQRRPIECPRISYQTPM
jgi:hypothetical protein